MTSCSSSGRLGGRNNSFPRNEVQTFAGTARFILPPARQSTKRLRPLVPLLVPSVPAKRPACSPCTPASVFQSGIPQLGLARLAASSSTEAASCPTTVPNMSVVPALQDTGVSLVHTQFGSVAKQQVVQVPVCAPLTRSGVPQNGNSVVSLVERIAILSPVQRPLFIEMFALNNPTGTLPGMSESCASKGTSSQSPKQEEVVAFCMPSIPRSSGSDSSYHRPRHEVTKSGTSAASKSFAHSDVSLQSTKQKVVSVGSSMPATSVSSTNNGASFQSPSQEVVGSFTPATSGSASKDNVSSECRRQRVVSVPAPFYRCTLGDCKFGSDAQQQFVRHLASHTVKELGALLCVYCRQAFDVITRLVRHMVESHGRRCYQCDHCPYRSVFVFHLQVHLCHIHSGMKPLPKHKATTALRSRNPIGRSVQLAHYQCSILGCSYKNHSPDRFVCHLVTEHPTAKNYRCHICSGAVNNVRSLLYHYTEHNIGNVQCAYCNHSEASYKMMLLHLSGHHSGCRPKLFVRTREQRDAVRRFIGDLVERTGHVTGKEEARTVGITSTVGAQQQAAGKPRLVIPRASSDPCPSDEADIPPEICSWHTVSPRLPCALCKRVAPSAHLLRMHTSLRHSAGSSAKRKPSEVAKLLGDFLKPMLPAPDGEKKRLSQRNKKLCTEGLVKLEPESDNDAQKETESDHAVHTCKKCGQTFTNESALHNHMYDKHRYFAECVYCKIGCVNRRIMMEHLRKAHPSLKKCFVALSCKRKRTEDQPAPKCSPALNDTAFSWYNVCREPVDMDSTYVMLQPASSKTPIRIPVYNVFKLYNINPRVVVKDFATCAV
ncbi:unnamed protein product [Ixodes hexagonus]